MFPFDFVHVVFSANFVYGALLWILILARIIWISCVAVRPLFCGGVLRPDFMCDALPVNFMNGSVLLDFACRALPVDFVVGGPSTLFRAGRASS